MRTAVFVILFGITATAQGPAGVWELSYTTSTGQPRQAKLTLQVEGVKLAGTIEGELGTAKIEDGKISGSDISLTLIRQGSSDEITVTYTGKVEGDTMKLKMQYRDRQPVEILAKRVSG